jgi:hypothetical protein
LLLGCHPDALLSEACLPVGRDLLFLYIRRGTARRGPAAGGPCPACRRQTRLARFCAFCSPSCAVISGFWSPTCGERSRTMDSTGVLKSDLSGTPRGLPFPSLSDGRGVQSKDLGLACFRNFEENRGCQQFQSACSNSALYGYKPYLGRRYEAEILESEAGEAGDTPGV